MYQVPFGIRPAMASAPTGTTVSEPSPFKGWANAISVRGANAMDPSDAAIVFSSAGSQPRFPTKDRAAPVREIATLSAWASEPEPAAVANVPGKSCVAGEITAAARCDNG